MVRLYPSFVRIMLMGEKMRSCLNYNCSPHGGPGEGPQSAKLCKFQRFLLQIQMWISQVVLCVVTFISEESKLFITTPGVAPLDPYRGHKIRERGTSKENYVSLILFQNAW